MLDRLHAPTAIPGLARQLSFDPHGVSDGRRLARAAAKAAAPARHRTILIRRAAA